MASTAALQILEQLYAIARTRLREQVVVDGKVKGSKLQAVQVQAHGLAYFATELEACRQLQAWAANTGDTTGLADIYTTDFLASLRGSIDLGTGETVTLEDMGLTEGDRAVLNSSEIHTQIQRHSPTEGYLNLATHLRDQGMPTDGLAAGPDGDDTLTEIRKQFARFTDDKVIPIAQEVHQKDVLIPMDILEQMTELGVFGLTIPEQYDGLGMDKVAMCVVTEELSRGYIGVGSLGTRTEIAAELILGGGTDAQKSHWLPKLANGEILPTAVFTEPNIGSDLAHLGTRAVKQPDGAYQITGQKTWITHAVRADLMTVLARTNPGDDGYGGLSMFLAEKTRKNGHPGEPEFVDTGLTGTEIKVLGYRGMKEYELSFDGFTVKENGLLGGEEGQGFKQLMRTFESARIQTAARGVGVAQAALDDALLYSGERIQFGRPIFDFPRVAHKIGRMVARIQAARQLSYHAARRKDAGHRSDLEAGMAKLLATRAAWEAADANVQIHGGNGFAEEYLASRLLVDSRVLSIFEGANEIQAHVVARRLLE